MGGEFPLGEREPILAELDLEELERYGGLLDQRPTRLGGTDGGHGAGGETAAGEDAGRVDGAAKGERGATGIRADRGDNGTSC